MTPIEALRAALIRQVSDAKTADDLIDVRSSATGLIAEIGDPDGVVTALLDALARRRAQALIVKLEEETSRLRAIAYPPWLRR